MLEGCTKLCVYFEVYWWCSYLQEEQKKTPKHFSKEVSVLGKFKEHSSLV